MPTEQPTIDYTEITWDYGKKKRTLSDKAKFQLRKLGMSRDGIAQLTSANIISSQKDMQIIAMVVSKAMG